MFFPYIPPYPSSDFVTCYSDEGTWSLSPNPSVEYCFSSSSSYYYFFFSWFDSPSVSTWQHTPLTSDRHPCLRWELNPQSQQGSDRRPKP